MSGKNVRNTSNQTVLNFIAEQGPTGAIGPTGATGSPGSMLYSVSGTVNVVFDPNSDLFPTPINSTLTCERFGNKIFISLAGILASPGGINTTIISNAGVIPVGFRPASNQNCICIVINGYQNPLPAIAKSPPWNSVMGCARLYTNGTLEFGASMETFEGPIDETGTVLNNFQGPFACGFIKQTLVFDAN